ncbi:hypothetical protein L1987_01597 [Smallanthus sonchifolius]|uniref:Uncharacterized protein n=1 Tax=Smallanthus sonchifolius TaxID=185202 RepID=A0ACB9K5E1_9ASTR|nr:hypothetical protein L1987_01597 [Smallanthus sonchifolius]
MVPIKTDTIEEGANSIEVIVGKDMVMREAQTKNEVTQKSENKIEHQKRLLAATIKGDWLEVESILKKDEGLVTEAIRGDGSTILHIAVVIGHNSILKRLIPYINDEQVLKQRGSDVSTALHIAAIIGNKGAANLLVKKNRKLLLIKDGNGEEPLQKACENMLIESCQ